MPSPSVLSANSSQSMFAMLRLLSTDHSSRTMHLNGARDGAEVHDLDRVVGIECGMISDEQDRSVLPAGHGGSARVLPGNALVGALIDDRHVGAEAVNVLGQDSCVKPLLSGVVSEVGPDQRRRVGRWKVDHVHI